MNSTRTSDPETIPIPGLAPEHRVYLNNHAVSDDIIAAQGIISDKQVIVFPWKDGEHETLQRRPWPGEAGQYLWETGRPLHLNAILDTPDKPVLLCEGTKQSLAVASWVPRDENGQPQYAVYGMPGCYGWISGGYINVSWARGRQVLILLDADAAGNLNVYEAGERLAAELTLQDPPAEAVFVPSPAWGKQGIDDYLAKIPDSERTGRLARLISAVIDDPPDETPARRRKRLEERGRPAASKPRRRPARPADAPDTGGRALVLVNRDRREVIESIASALYEAHWRDMFNFGGALSWVEGHQAQPLEKGPLLALLPQVAACYRYREATSVAPARYDPDCWPDNQTIEAVLSSAKRFLPLRRIARVPFARPDGTACTIPGYDTATETLLVTDLALPPVPDQPGPEYAAAAASFLLDDWLGDMPFKDGASRANVLALILTSLIRDQVPIVPMAVVSGLQPGVGKGLLTDCISILITGEPTPPLPYTPDDEAETRKKITAAFISGADLFIFDEAHVIQGAELARAITSLTYQDRVLGVSKTVQFPNNVTWAAMGNQVQVNADMARRVYFIELSPDCPDPENRDESLFAHPDLREWTRENRARLVHAALVLIRAWHAAGQPRHRRGALMGSFERWDKLISDILGHAGVDGFLGNLAERRAESDFSGGYWAGHIAWLARTFGSYPVAFTALEVKSRAQASSGEWDAPPNLDNLMDSSFARKLGQAYARNKDRWHGPHRLIKVGTGHGTIVRWAIQSQNGHVPTLGELTLPPGPPSDPFNTSSHGPAPAPPTPPTPPASQPNGHSPSPNGASAYVSSGSPWVTQENILPDPIEISRSSGGTWVANRDSAESSSPATGPHRPDGTDGTNPEIAAQPRDGTDGTPPVAEPVEQPVDGTDGVTTVEACGKPVNVANVTDGTDGSLLPSRAREIKNFAEVEKKMKTQNQYTGAGDTPPLPPFHPFISADGPSTALSQVSIGFDLETCDADELFRGASVPSADVSAGQVGTPVPAGNNGNDVSAGQVGTPVPAGNIFISADTPDPRFIRLAGLIGPAGQPVITTDPEQLISVLDSAGEIYGHNILSFDGMALAWHHRRGDPGWWERFAARARDTLLIARQAHPPASRETGTSADKYDLDHVAERLGVAGKTNDLKQLAKKHGGYGLIPTDDPEYRSYLEGDLLATKAVADLYHKDAYLVREHELAAITGRMTLNGFRVDQSLLEQRLEAGQQRKLDALAELSTRHGLPLSKTVIRGRGKNKYEIEEPFDSPLASKPGKAWLQGVWDYFGVTSPPRTDTKELATGRDALAPIAATPGCDPRLIQIIELMTIVTTTRTIYQTATDWLCPDGRVHSKIVASQASGRWSVTEPGMTVFGKRGGRHVERDIFLPDEGHVLLSCDLSQVDMRAVSGHSQDPAYAEMFAPGRDAHTEIAKQVGLDREAAKAIGHGWTYGLGANRMIRNGLDPAKVYAFVNGMTERFPRLIEWREEIRAAGAAGQTLDNGFGRHMRCEPSRAYTVAPALMGQGGARDIMGQCMLNLPAQYRSYLRTIVHDEILLSIPVDEVAEVKEAVREAFTWIWFGTPILCDFSGPGPSWGAVSAK